MTTTINVPAQAPSAVQPAMTLEEARLVLWIRDNPRPMGELFDEGFLTTDRLKWTAQYAYSKRMRDAAVALSSLSAPTQPEGSAPSIAIAEPLPAPMSVEAARNVIWPFREIKGRSMGELLDLRLLTLKDLSYAAENARDRKVRQAAVTLVLDRLAQVEPPSGHMHVIKSERRSYSEVRQLQLVLLAGMLAGSLGTAGLFATGLWLVKYIPFWQDPATIALLASPSGLIAMGIVIAASLLVNRLGGIASNRITDRFDKELRAHRMGQLGEEHVVEALRAQLDSEWTLFRNIVLPGRKGGDLDAVLVGPTGIWALEVKNFTGVYRYVRNRWERTTKRGWEPVKSDPAAQARRNAARLHGFLEADDMAQYVNGVVVWANPDSPIEVADSDTPVWKLDRLEAPLTIARSRSALPSERLARIREKLERLTLAEPK